MYVRNLPFKITAEEMYDIFGKYGAVYQIRLGERGKDTRGTAFVGAFTCHLCHTADIWPSITNFDLCLCLCL